MRPRASAKESVEKVQAGAAKAAQAAAVAAVAFQASPAFALVRPLAAAPGRPEASPVRAPGALSGKSPRKALR